MTLRQCHTGRQAHDGALDRLDEEVAFEECERVSVSYSCESEHAARPVPALDRIRDFVRDGG